MLCYTYLNVHDDNSTVKVYSGFSLVGKLLLCFGSSTLVATELPMGGGFRP